MAKFNLAEVFQPKILENFKKGSYNKQAFTADLIAGIIVAIIALPLSIALALASGVEPACGIYTAIAAGFCVSLFGGSRIQIAGPTAAFATIVAIVIATVITVVMTMISTTIIMATTIVSIAVIVIIKTAHIFLLMWAGFCLLHSTWSYKILLII